MRNGDPTLGPEGTDDDALDDRTRQEIEMEQTAWERAPNGLRRHIERFDREGRA